MKLAIVVPSLANSGPIIVARDIVLCLLRAISIEVFYFKDADDELSFPVPTRKIGLTDADALIEFDIVHLHELRPELLGLIGHRKWRRNDVRTVTTMHAYVPTALRYNYGRLAKTLIAPVWRQGLIRRDRVVTLSKSMEKFYGEWGVAAERLVTIPNGRNPPSEIVAPDAEMVSELQRLKTDYAIIGGVGRLDAVKGFDQVIRCLPEHPEWVFVLIGDGVERERLESLARTSGVADRVRFLGYKSNAVAFYPYFDVYALVSHHEGLPLVLLEAAMHGTPTVCSRLPTLTEFFEPDQVAYYEPGNLPDLGAAIHRALEDGAAMGARMNEHYRHYYTRERMGASYLELYESLLSDG